MSYQVLARKWRPRKFAELVGQEHVVRALTNALETGRMHHAYLFTGTRGVAGGAAAFSAVASQSMRQTAVTMPAGHAAFLLLTCRP